MRQAWQERGGSGMIWIIGAILVAILGVALAGPMLKARPATPGGAGTEDAPPSGAARDLAVYRDQLRGVEADAASGRIGADEAAQLRTEIGRRLLDADRVLRSEARTKGAAEPAAGTGKTGASGPGRLAGLLGVAGAALVLAGGFASYAWLGSPDLPDAPRNERIAAAQARYEQRPTQAEAEARAPAPNPVTPPEGFMDLMEQLRARMDERPEPQGLRMLADYEVRLGNLTAAHEAMARLIALEGGAAGADLHLARAVLLIDAAGGLVTAEAEAEIAATLAIEPENPQARFLRGLMLGQTGRPDRAFPIWRALLIEGPADAPWNAVIRDRIAELAWYAGDPDNIPAAGTPAMPATPDPDAAAAIAAMDDESRAEAIAGMVRSLEERLVREGGTAQEWAQLVQALGVQGDLDQARLIRDKARGIFRGDNASLAVIDAAGVHAGLD